MAKKVLQKEKSSLAEIGKGMGYYIEVKCPKCNGLIPIGNNKVTLDMQTLICIFCSYTFDFDKEQIKRIKRTFQNMREYFEILMGKL